MINAYVKYTDQNQNTLKCLEAMGLYWKAENMRDMITYYANTVTTDYNQNVLKLLLSLRKEGVEFSVDVTRMSNCEMCEEWLQLVDSEMPDE